MAAALVAALLLGGAPAAPAQTAEDPRAVAREILGEKRFRGHGRRNDPPVPRAPPRRRSPGDLDVEEFLERLAAAKAARS